MDINVLLKLAKLKRQEINSLRDDFITLEKIVIDLEKKLEIQLNFMAEFIRDYANNKSYCDNTASILNGRFFLDKLRSENKSLENSKQVADTQRDAAFKILKESALELMQLKKVILKEYKLKLDVNSRKELLLDDTLEIYRYNRVNS